MNVQISSRVTVILTGIVGHSTSQHSTGGLVRGPFRTSPFIARICAEADVGGAVLGSTVGLTSGSNSHWLNVGM